MTKHSTKLKSVPLKPNLRDTKGLPLFVVDWGKPGNLFVCDGVNVYPEETVLAVLEKHSPCFLVCENFDQWDWQLHNRTLDRARELGSILRRLHTKACARWKFKNDVPFDEKAHSLDASVLWNVVAENVTQLREIDPIPEPVWSYDWDVQRISRDGYKADECKKYLRLVEDWDELDSIFLGWQGPRTPTGKLCTKASYIDAGYALQVIALFLRLKEEGKLSKRQWKKELGLYEHRKGNKLSSTAFRSRIPAIIKAAELAENPAFTCKKLPRDIHRKHFKEVANTLRDYLKALFDELKASSTAMAADFRPKSLVADKLVSSPAEDNSISATDYSQAAE